jgi:hypothetical protein
MWSFARGKTPEVNPQSGFTTGYKPWIQAWSLRSAQTPEAKLQSSFATSSSGRANDSPNITLE